MDRKNSEAKTKGLIGPKSKRYDWNLPIDDGLDPIAPPLVEGAPPRLAAPAPPRRMTKGFSLSEQIDCVTREVALRENTYPRQIAAGRLTEAEAARKIARMRAVLETLINLRRMIESLPYDS